MHIFQKHILDELRRVDTLRYSQLQPDGVESSHFRYHLSQLVKEGLVDQLDRGVYALSEKGIAAVDRLSEHRIHAHSSPKVITYTLLEDEGNYYLQLKDKEPYRGLLNMIGGKVHTGETCQQAAVREVLEKAGIRISGPTLRTIAEIKIASSDTLLSHVIAYVYTTNVRTTTDTSKLRSVAKTAVSDSRCAPDLWPLIRHIESTTMQPLVLDLTL